MHKNVNENMFYSHFYANFHEFLWWTIKATNMLQLYAASFLYGSPVLLELHHVFPILMVQILIFPYLTGPWPQLQKGRENPCIIFTLNLL